VGWVQRVLVNQRSGFVVDGHAWVALAITRGETFPDLPLAVLPQGRSHLRRDGERLPGALRRGLGYGA
jgi:hypothetical protein